MPLGILRNISPLPTVVPLDLDNGILFPRLYPFLAISLLDLSKEVSSQLGQQVSHESLGYPVFIGSAG
jgi:hypothetical protein